jgi:hypothetical protein
MVVEPPGRGDEMTIMQEGPWLPPEVPDASQDLGRKIKGFRLIRGMELAEVSAMTGISPDTLKLYERGRRVPGGYRMLLIMDALKLVPADLLKTEV